MGRENYFSQRFKAIREATNLSIQMLGEKANITRATIYRYESGDSIPSTINIWISLAKAHGMSLPEYLDALFGKKNLQPDEIKRLESRVGRLEDALKQCPLMADTS